MIFAVIQLVMFFVGCVVLAIIIVLLLIRLLDKGLDALVEHLRPHAISGPLNTSDHIGYKRANSKPSIDFTDIWVYSHEAFDEVHHKLIITMLHNKLTKKHLSRFYSDKHRHEEDNTTNNKHKPRYLECLVPIKHIKTIVAKLRKLVNKNGKEPAMWVPSPMSALPQPPSP